MQGVQLQENMSDERPPMPLGFKILFILCMLGFAYLTFSVIKDWNYRAGTNIGQDIQAGRN